MNTLAFHIKQRESIWSNKKYWEDIFFKKTTGSQLTEVLKRMETSGGKISFLDEIIKNINKESFILDIGTGSGEICSKEASHLCH